MKLVAVRPTCINIQKVHFFPQWMFCVILETNKYFCVQHWLTASYNGNASVYCEVGTEILYIYTCNLALRVLKYVYVSDLSSSP